VPTNRNKTRLIPHLLLHTELIAEVGTNQLSVKKSIATQGTLILPLKLDWSSLPHDHAPHDLEHVCRSLLVWQNGDEEEVSSRTTPKGYASKAAHLCHTSVVLDPNAG
jgi:hypothetical protein